MDPEGVKIEGLEIVQEIGLRKNERRAAQSTIGADIGDQVPEGGRQARASVLEGAWQRCYEATGKAGFGTF
jgi:hypothetical protein